MTKDKSTSSESASYGVASHAVFSTIQGEGHLSGLTQVFVRLSGCPVACPGCDTNYRAHGSRWSLDKLSLEIQLAMPSGLQGRDRWVWITGGEPTIWNLDPLVNELHRLGYSVAIATSGINPVTPPVEWLSVSPHGGGGGKLVQRWGHEIKLVPGLNDLDAVQWIEDNDEPNENSNSIDFWFRFVQPLWLTALWRVDPESLRQCKEIWNRWPRWGITMQTNKWLNLP